MPENFCGDCGVDTCPVDRPGAWEWYVVRNVVWREAGMPVPDGVKDDTPSGDGFLCIGCLEERLRRRLTPEDFTSFPVNAPSPISSPRLLDRLGAAA